MGTIDICTDVKHEHHPSWRGLEVNLRSTKMKQKFLMEWVNTMEYYLAVKMNDNMLWD